MMFKCGDQVTGEKISVGEFLGQEYINMSGTSELFYKIYEHSKQVVHYVPICEGEALKKLPSKSVVRKYLDLLKGKDFIDVSEVEGSRYRYFEQKIEGASFRARLEVLHDLSLLKKEKKMTIAEHRIFNKLHETLAAQVSCILKIEQIDSESLLFQ